jgi:pyridinium-3,5-bisthiocarboxylic acid mononucleotide nickel chelatase
MSRIAYFDCFSGASGDMIIGSLLDAGLDLEILKNGLAGLDIRGYRLAAEKVQRASITATQFNVEYPQTDQSHHPGPGQHHRGLAEILQIIDTGRISDSVKIQSASIFGRLGEVEAGIHGVPVEEVHFHELGAIDTIIDVVGTLLALEALKIDRIYSSPLVVGSGTVKTAHGILPVPAPATLQILADAHAPIIAAPPAEKPPGELLTPTGAVLLTHLSFGYNRPDLKVEKAGYGAGHKQFPHWPNVLRLWIGEEIAAPETGEMVLLETNIDDMNPQIYGYLMEKLLASGAADVWFTPIQMKKNRPAVMLSVLGPAGIEDKLSTIVMRETTTLGIRSRHIARHIAQREIIESETSLGRVHAKVKRFGDMVDITPEYEDCRRIALEHDLPLQEITRIVKSEIRRSLGLPY